MTRRRVLSFRFVLASLLIGALGAAVVPAAAAPGTPGSPLVGKFCSKGAPITGRGATFATNAHNLVFKPAFASLCNKGSLTYLAGGSGAGQNGIVAGIPDLNGSDEPLTPLDQALASTGGPIHTIPIAVGAVTVSANLTACGIGQEELKLRSPVVAAIYSGVITSWNNAVVANGNPKLKTCNLPIKLVARSDVSGTTYIFKDWLSKRNPWFHVWKNNALNTAWPASLLGKAIIRGNGNSGVANAVKNTSGAIGYVELSTAKSAGLKWAKVDGPHSLFVSPIKGTAANCVQAALGATTPPSTLSPGWDVASITDSPNPLAYPVCGFTYVFIPQDLTLAFGAGYSPARAQTLVDYMSTAIDNRGQSGLGAKGYARLPINIQAIALVGLASVDY